MQSSRRNPQGRYVIDLPPEWTNALNEFIANQVPIRLIDLKKLRFVSRSDVTQYCRPILGAYIAKNPNMHYCPSPRRARRILMRVVKYAIFSHRWLTKGEPTFHDMDQVSKFASALVQDGEAALARTLEADVPDGDTRAGLGKLLSFCSKARLHGCRFAWSDTCCINKDSSTELDETIRSMFRWYRNAYICIAYLSGSLVLDDISADEWFTRGWTLQELLAPERIKFYNREWKAFTKARNDKERQNSGVLESRMDSLWQAVLAATHIPSSEISFFRPGAFNVAQRLSWMAGRRTTRIEDMSYALMGIFDIHIAVQYGEGEFAFQRLMEALLLRVRGIDIFSWTGPSSRHSVALPASIEGYMAVKRATDQDIQDVALTRLDGPSMMLTHKGLELEVLLVPMKMEGMSAVTGGSYVYECPPARWSPATSEIADEEMETSSVEQSDEYIKTNFDGRTRTIEVADNQTFCEIRFIDPNSIFEPLEVSSKFMVHRDGSRIRSVDGPQKFEFFIAILDYHRDEERGPRGASVLRSGRSKHLAFVLCRGPENAGWWKLETDELIFAEVRARKKYKGETVSIYL